VIIPDQYIFTCGECPNWNVDIIKKFVFEKNTIYSYDIRNHSDFQASPSEFVRPLAKFVKAVYHIHVSIGTDFRMLLRLSSMATFTFPFYLWRV
jgi:microsomal dipeptidase-like Zn-dependent dipeptidase